MPPLIGLTGGIGSGKTTVAKLFEELGIPVYYSDAEAKKLYDNPDIRHQISAAVGVDLFVGGELNRPLLSRYLFADPELRARVNGIIHPKVRENFAHFCQSHAEAPYVINEAAILFETGTYKNFNRTILVVAPETVKLERLRLRDGLTDEAIRERMDAQWTDEQKMPLADFIIQNDGTHSLKEQVMEVHGELMG